MNPLTQRARRIYEDYPSTFWTLIGAYFVDRLGGAVLFPFFARYASAHFPQYPFDRLGIGQVHLQ